MKKLLFGTAGIPISTLRNDDETNIKQVRELGLIKIIEGGSK